MNTADAVRKLQEIGQHLEMSGDGSIISYERNVITRTLQLFSKIGLTVWEDFTPSGNSLGRHEWEGFHHAELAEYNQVILEFQNNGGKARVVLHRDHGPRVEEVSMLQVPLGHEGTVS